MTENKAARTEGVLKALRTYRAEQGLSAPFPTLSAALFDMDGVLFDSMPAHCRSWVQAAHEVGLQMSEEDVYWFEGQTGSYTIKLLYQRTLGRDASPEETKWLYERKTQLFNEYNSGKTLPGVELVLAQLSDVERLVVTGSSQASLLGRLDEAFPKVFSEDLMVTGKDVRRGKPDPEPYQRAAAYLGVAPEAMLVLEDSDVGAQAALAAGCPVFLLAADRQPAPQIAQAVRRIIQHHDAVREVLL